MRLLTALFTTRPALFTDMSLNFNNSQPDALQSSDGVHPPVTKTPAERADDVVGILSSIVPNLPKILVEQDRVLTAASSISTNVIGPAIRSKNFPDTITKGTLALLRELARLPGNQKTWKKDISDAFNDVRFFGSAVALVRSDWLPLLRQWTLTDNKDRMLEILARITPPTTAGIVFGVGATSARLEADRRTQLNLRRVAALVLASAPDAFVAELPPILDRLVELLAATATSSPSSTTRAEVYMVVRALALRTTAAVHLSPLWPVVNAELQAAVASCAAKDDDSNNNSSSSSSSNNTFGAAAVLQACKLLDLLVAVAPDDFQLHEWLFVTDTVDAVYRSAAAAVARPVALVDDLSEVLGNGPFTETDTGGGSGSGGGGSGGSGGSSSSTKQEGDGEGVGGVGGEGRKQKQRRPLLANAISPDDLALVVENRKEELVARVLRPFFGQLSIFAFESTYAMGALDEEACVVALLRDLFDERTVVKAL